MGITLDTNIRLERILSEFLSPLPGWVFWLVNRQLKKHMSNPQMGYLPIIKGVQ